MDENERQALWDPGAEYALQVCSDFRSRPSGKGNLLRRLMALILRAALAGTVAGCVCFGVSTFLTGAAGTSAEATGDSAPVVTTVKTAGSYGQSLDVSGIAAAGLPSVVSVTNVSVQEVESYFGRYGRNGRGGSRILETTSCGSGVIVYDDGAWLYMVTNYHVVENASALSVTFAGDETYEARLCGYSEESDIAVLKTAVSELSEGTLEQIRVVSIGSSDDLAVGQQVVAIGNALGYGQSVTTGIVSAVDRVLSGDTSAYIQTDAAINPGNSGGALLNMDGELVGINTAKISTTAVEGMGYAIPISAVLELITSMIC